MYASLRTEKLVVVYYKLRRFNQTFLNLEKFIKRTGIPKYCTITFAFATNVVVCLSTSDRAPLYHVRALHAYSTCNSACACACLILCVDT